MSLFGDIEEFISKELYPYRWPIVIGVVVAFAAAGWRAFRMGWHKPVLRQPVLSGAIAVVFVAALAYPTYYLGSPLFDSGKTVCEASPIAGAEAGSERCVSVAEAAEDGATLAATAPAAKTPAADFTARETARGEFEGADDFHFGRGQALLIESAPGQYVLRFEEFEVRNGPDLFVYVSTSSNDYSDDALELGELKGTNGACNYDVPPGTDVSQIKSAVVWCKQFGVLFAVAPLM